MREHVSADRWYDSDTSCYKIELLVYHDDITTIFHLQGQVLYLPLSQLIQDVAILSLSPAQKLGNATAIVAVKMKLATMPACGRRM